jgi:uncharacterized protein YuzE
MKIFLTTFYFDNITLTKRPYVSLEICIELNLNPSLSSSEVAAGVVLDFDQNNKITGIEIENASKSFDLTKLESNSIPLRSS